MNVHKNARMTPWSRGDAARRVTQHGASARRVAAEFRVSERTVRKWAARFAGEGWAGLPDRSSRPHHSPRATATHLVLRIERLRQERWTCAAIAEAIGVSRATVARIVGRRGWSRLRALEPRPPLRRYERDTPGSLLHFDTKKLGRIVRPGHRISGNRRDRVRGAGWEYVHICVDDASRWALGTVLPDEGVGTSVGFLRRAVRRLKELGVRVSQVMTDNGNAYRSQRFAQACRALGIRHLFTRPYTPRTNGKAERFIQSALREWAYARSYPTSHHRRNQLARWLHHYNWHRPHTSVGGRPPITRVLTADNLVRLHS
jgi:transposase InsO family protein